MSEHFDDRRERARKAYYNRYALGDHIGGTARKAAIRDCIEVATRVEITEDIIEAALNAVSAGRGARPRYANAITAAFRAAGFEVVE